MPLPGDIPRRGFLQKGILGGALLLVGGALPVALRGVRAGPTPKQTLALLTTDEHAILASIAARIVPGDGAGAGWPTAQALDCAGKIDRLMAQTHPRVGAEFRQLLHLFENGLGGLLTNLQPAPFSRCSPAQQDARLDHWRYSRLALLRSGYQALKRLCQATYYSSPETFARVGYPGPPEVPQRP